MRQILDLVGVYGALASLGIYFGLFVHNNAADIYLRTRPAERRARRAAKIRWRQDHIARMESEMQIEPSERWEPSEGR
jgi:hypothetical protein